MAAPPAEFTFLERLLKSRLVSEKQVNELFPEETDRQNTQLVGDGLVKAGLLTRYHVQMLQAGKHRGFFLGPYKILRPIGQGGMGTVFLAEHTTLSRRVAVKVLPPDKAKDKLTLERFNREARAAAALDHPNIVRLHDISQGNGVNFLVMEYVDGNDLQSLMGQTGPLHYAQAAQYIAQAAAGLHHAHEKGFIHRDIKPANLILAKQGGSIKILDMGLARSFTDKADNLTADLANGDIAGTIDYLSPEQAMNMPLDERSDIYSLGATFYALVAGYPPFKGTTAQKLMQHQLKEPPSVSLKLSGRVPQALSDVISKMMSKKPSERFQTAADVLDALGPWLPVATTGNIITDPAAHTPMPGTHGSMTRPIRKSTRVNVNVVADGEEEVTPLWKKPAVLIGGGVGLVLLIGGIITAVALSGGDKKPDGNARQPGQQQPNTNNPNTPKSTYKVPYTKIDFAGMNAATMQVGGTGKGEVVKAINGQQLPTGVMINHFNGQSVGEYSIAEVNGATAIGLKQTNKLDGVQVHFFSDGSLSRLPDGARATLRLTYLFDGTGEGSTFYELTGEPYTKYSTTKLPNTGGKWKTVDVPFTRPTGGKGYEFVVNAGNSPHAEGTIYVRSAEILPPDAPPPVTGAVYELDATKVAPFARRGQTAEQNGPNELKAAAGWTTEVYDKAGQGNFGVRNEDGMAEFGVAATGERNCAQLVFRSHEMNAAVDPIEEGKKYTVIIEYRTDKNTDGFSSAQTMDEWNTISNANLTDTSGEWKTVSYNFTRPVGKKIQITMGPKAPTGGFVWIRRFYVTSEDGVAQAPARGGKPLYSLDLSGQKAFTRTGSSEATGDPAEDVRFVEKSRTGDGDLPTGWRGMPWDRTSEAVFLAEEKAGKMAFGMKNVKTGTEFANGFTGMLFSPKMSFTGPFRVRFTYLTDCDYPKAVQVKFKATAPTPRGAVAVSGTDDLPGTGGKWVTKEIEVNPNTSTDGYIEFHLFDSDTARGFYLSEMSVTGPGQPAEVVAPPQPKSNVPVDPVKADFTAFKDGTFPLTSTAISLDASGWNANQYAAGDTGELIVATEDGAKVLTLVNKTGKGSAQVYQAKAGPALSAGASYMLKLEYKAADGTSGKLEVREKDVGNWKDCPHVFKLDSTGDRWEKRTFELEATRDYPTVFVLQNAINKAGNRLSIRSIEIVPLGGGR